jgi:hypothetical protein
VERPGFPNVNKNLEDAPDFRRGRVDNYFPKKWQLFNNFDCKSNNICTLLVITLIDKDLKLRYKIKKCQPWHTFFI